MKIDFDNRPTQYPNNLGALFRIAYAYAINYIIVLDRFMPEENAYIASVVSGALDKINIFKVANLVTIIKFLKKIIGG